MNVPADTGRPTVPAYERLARRIQEQIMSGELNSDDQLPTESELAAQHNVSRSTTRESLRTLASQGLIRPSVESPVAHSWPVPTGEDVSSSPWTLLTESAHISMASLIEVREMLEIPAAEVVALRRTDDELAALRESLFDLRTATVGPGFEITRSFHTQVLAATHNPSSNSSWRRCSGSW